MLIDCDTCVGRGRSCGGCVVSILLEQSPVARAVPTVVTGFRSAEQRLDPSAVVQAPAGGFDGQLRLAISVLLDAGMVAEVAAPERELAAEVAPVTLFGTESARQAS
jgi:TctA family transporter